MLRCLHKSGGALQYTPEKCAKFIVVCAYLHNVCVDRGVPLLELVEEDAADDEPEMGYEDLGNEMRDRMIALF